MAKQTTTKQAAVWKPPRLRKLALGRTDSGSKRFDANDVIYEGPRLMHQIQALATTVCHCPVNPPYPIANPSRVENARFASAT